MKHLFLLLSFAFLQTILMAQTDTLITNDKTVLTGEIKEMDKGVLTFKTGYSDKDFRIEWLKVKGIHSKQEFRVLTSDGGRYSGKITSIDSNQTIVIVDPKNGIIMKPPEEIVYLKQLDKGSFFDILNLSLDFGYSFTSSNHLRQFNGSMNADYTTNTWGLSSGFSSVNSSQENADPVQRNNGNLNFKAFFTGDYFFSADGTFYQNKEQNLKMQSNYVLGIGYYFVHTNRVYFNAFVGTGYNNEVYFDTTTTRRTVEGNIGTAINMFDIGDLNLFTKLNFYPSITEKGRIRSTVNLTAKYDLPRDFYIKGSLDYKFDNHPADGVDPHDYVYTFGIGWEL